MNACPMSTQNLIAAHCSALLKKRHFSSYDDPAMIIQTLIILLFQTSDISNFADVMLKLLLIS
jgi:hypothetical protein